LAYKAGKIKQEEKPVNKTCFSYMRNFERQMGKDGIQYEQLLQHVQHCPGAFT
jgi:hypothetical protein